MPCNTQALSKLKANDSYFDYFKCFLTKKEKEVIEQYHRKSNYGLLQITSEAMTTKRFEKVKRQAMEAHMLKLNE